MHRHMYHFGVVYFIKESYFYNKLSSPRQAEGQSADRSTAESSGHNSPVRVASAPAICYDGEGVQSVVVVTLQAT